MDDPTSSSQDYRAFWTTDAPPGWTASVLSQAAGWLGPKFGGDVDLARDGIVRGEAKRLEIRRHDHDSKHGVRFVMEEENRGGRFVTTLTSVEADRGGGWVSLDVLSDAGSFVNRPRLAGYLLDVLELRDGTRMTATPHRATAARVSDVIAALENPGRRGPILVAATDDKIPFDPFARLVDGWTSETVGLAQAYVLDPLASVELNARLGQRWGVPAWTIRTYLPGIDLSSPVGARANRILGTARLGNDRDKYLARLLGGVARSVIADRPAPPQWRSWQRTFVRVSTSAIAESATPRPGRSRREVAAPAPVLPDLAPDVARLEAELERVRITLELADLSESALLEVLDAATSDRIEPESLRELREELDRQRRGAELTEKRLDASQLKLLVAEDDGRRAEAERERQERRARYLTKALVENNLASIAFGEVPEGDESVDDYGSEPVTYASLLERIGEFRDRGVVFTGDLKDVEGLELIDVEGKALTMAWTAVVSLCEYARAKKSDKYQGNVHKFLEDQLPGYRCYPLNQHAATETGFTKKQYKGTRRFPVPKEIDVSGLVDMYEHFKLARIDNLDQRMHYYDDTTGTGIIYIGYLGTHLVNAMTSKL